MSAVDLAAEFFEDFAGFDDLNPALLDMAKRAAVKQALIPPGQGPPPPDPAAGGMPMPGGAPPTDPSMGGAMPGGMPGQPPMDPSLMGQPPMQPGMQQPGMAPGAPGGKGGKAQTEAKLDRIIADLYQQRHLLVSVMKFMNMPIPDEAILGPAPPTPPQDPTQMAPSPAVAGAGALAQPGGGAPPAPGGAPGGMPAPMPGPMPGGDPGKAAMTDEEVESAADALLRMLRESDYSEDGKAAGADGEDRRESDYWAMFQKAAAPADAGPPEPIGTAISSSALGPLRNQPLLMAMKAREAARRAGGAA